MSKEPKLGSGKRFKNLANKLARKGVNDPDAVAAKIGMNKYGKKKMLNMAHRGKLRHEKERHESED